MRTGLVLNDIFMRHAVPADFPERPERISAIRDALTEHGLAERCARIDPVEAPLEAIELIHDRAYIERVRAAALGGDPHIDTPEAPLCRDTFDIARLATGSLLSAVERVASGDLANAFCVVRPPGHHAERDTAMGFCFFNSVAVAAAHLVERRGFERVLVLDWDVHHGNGTQHSFEENGKVLFASIHGHPATLYPGTGFSEERGKGEGLGKTLNITMAPRSTDADYRKAVEEIFLPAAEAFAPQFLLISAGFDAYRGDPVGDQALDPESYRWLTETVLRLADRHAQGRLVSVLEGGYDLEGLARCAAVHLETLLDWKAPTLGASPR